MPKMPSRASLKDPVVPGRSDRQLHSRQAEPSGHGSRGHGFPWHCRRRERLWHHHSARRRDLRSARSGQFRCPGRRRLRRRPGVDLEIIDIGEEARLYCEALRMLLKREHKELPGQHPDDRSRQRQQLHQPDPGRQAGAFRRTSAYGTVRLYQSSSSSSAIRSNTASPSIVMHMAPHA